MGKKMILSEILKEMGEDYSYCENEKTFEKMSIIIPGYSAENRCVFIIEEAYLNKLDDSVKMVITTKNLADKIRKLGKGVYITENPRLKFYEIHNYLASKTWYRRKKYKTLIGNDCRISKFSSIAEQNVRIGNNVTIENFVDIKENTVIEDNVVIRSGAVIGNPGFDYKIFEDRVIMTKQMGGVILGNGVEVGSNTCIERAAFPYEDTQVQKDSKIGCLCYISHGVQIGKRVFMPNCVSISGYTRIDDNVVIGPGATVSNIVHIGEGATISLGSVVGSTVKKNGHVTGNFAIPHDKFLENYRNSLL